MKAFHFLIFALCLPASAFGTGLADESKIIQLLSAASDLAHNSAECPIFSGSFQVQAGLNLAEKISVYAENGEFFLSSNDNYIFKLNSEPHSKGVPGLPIWHIRTICAAGAAMILDYRTYVPDANNPNTMIIRYGTAAFLNASGDLVLLNVLRKETFAPGSATPKVQIEVKRDERKRLPMERP